MSIQGHQLHPSPPDSAQLAPSRDLVRTLDHLGYLPSPAKEIQSTINRKASRQALWDDITNPYFSQDPK